MENVSGSRLGWFIGQGRSLDTREVLKRKVEAGQGRVPGRAEVRSDESETREAQVTSVEKMADDTEKLRAERGKLCQYHC